MALVNLPRIRLAQELKKEFPKMRKLEDKADVLLAGQELSAIDESNKQTRWEFVKKGAKDNAIYSAYKKYHLLTKKESERRAYFSYKRGGRLDNDSQIRSALQRERKGLFAHLIASAAARTAVASALSLPTNNLDLIRITLERGDVQEQLKTYGKAVNSLIIQNLYDEDYDYYWLGWRNVPHKYWLSKLALKLLSKAR